MVCAWQLQFHLQRSFARCQPVRLLTRKMCVSTAMVGSPKAQFSTTLAVCGPRRQGFSSLRVQGTGPMQIQQHLASLQQMAGLAVVQANGADVGFQSSRPSASMACGVLATGNSRRVALFTLTSVAWADNSTAVSSSNAGVFQLRDRLRVGCPEGSEKSVNGSWAHGGWSQVEDDRRVCLYTGAGAAPDFIRSGNSARIRFIHHQPDSLTMQFADRLNNVETSAIRELFKLLGNPASSALLAASPIPPCSTWLGIRETTNAALNQKTPVRTSIRSHRGATTLREQLAAFMQARGATVSPDQLIVTTGSQRALDLLGKTMISPGDKVIVEAPPSWPPSSASASTVPNSLPPCGRAGRADRCAGSPDCRAQAQVGVPHPHLRQPQRRDAQPGAAQKVLELAVKGYNTLVVEDDPYGDLYFGKAPPSLLALAQDRARQP